MRKILFIGLLAVAMTGCKSTKPNSSVAKTVLMPANVVGMQGAKSIAVVSVKPNDYYYRKHDVTSKLEAFLANVQLHGQPYFTVVDRQTMNNVLKEQRLSSKHTFDQQTSAKLGRLVGADTLMTATYVINNDTNHYYEKGRECIRQRESNGKLSKALGLKSCDQYRDTSTSCQKRHAQVELTPKATAVGTGHVIYAKSYKATMVSERCNNGYDDPLIPEELLVQQAFDNVFAQMRADIAPYFVTLNIDIMKKDKTEMPVATSALFNEGLFFVEESLFDRACAKFIKSAQQFSSPAIIYNVGVCHELKGDKQGALAYYNQALDMSSKLDRQGKKMVIAAIKRHKKRTSGHTANAEQAQKPSTTKSLSELAEGIGSLFNE